MIWGEGHLCLNYITDMLFLNLRSFAILLGKSTEEYYTEVDVAVKVLGRAVGCVSSDTGFPLAYQMDTHCL